MVSAADERMTRRATRLAALQILYGQQFHGETIQQIDPMLEEDGDDSAKSDRAFLARLLSCARTNRRPLQWWLAGRVTRRSWDNVDLLLRLILWLAATEMLLERVDGKGSVMGLTVSAIGKQINKIDEKIGEKIVEKIGNKKIEKKLGILAGEYCGIASLFYEDRGTIGFVNGILDGAASCDLIAAVEGWVIDDTKEKQKIEEDKRIKKEIIAKEKEIEQENKIREEDKKRWQEKNDEENDYGKKYGYGIEDNYNRSREQDIRRNDEEW